MQRKEVQISGLKRIRGEVKSKDLVEQEKGGNKNQEVLSKVGFLKKRANRNKIQRGGYEVGRKRWEN